MNLIVKIISNGNVIDNYECNDNFFKYNDKLIEIEDKLSKLIYLSGMTSNWNDEFSKNITNGVYVNVELNDEYKKEYFFYKEYPLNFLSFIEEIKKLREVK